MSKGQLGGQGASQVCPRLPPLVCQPRPGVLPPGRTEASLSAGGWIPRENERTSLALHSAGKGSSWAGCEVRALGGGSSLAGWGLSEGGMQAGDLFLCQVPPQQVWVQSTNSGAQGLRSQAPTEHRLLFRFFLPRVGARRSSVQKPHTARTPSLGLNLGYRKAMSETEWKLE